MSDFRDYFNSRITQEIENNAQRGVSTKYDEIQQALTDKVARFEKLRVEREAAEQRNKNSWVTKLGLDPNSTEAALVNDAASFISGGSKNVLGTIFSSAPNALSFIDQAGLNEQSVQAYNRYVQGTATEEDLTHLNTPYVSTNENIYGGAGGELTPFQKIERINKGREMGRDIYKTFDIGEIVHQGDRERFDTSMDNETTRAGLEQVSKGWDQLKQGNGQGLDNMVPAVGSLAWEAGKAAVDNPQAATEYILENIPQLAVGAVKGVGSALLALSNFGYGADLYQQGVENYQAKNDGALPPQELRQQMAMDSAKAAFMEHAADKIGLGLAKVTGSTAKEATKTSFKQALLNTGKAGVGGTGSEALTEGVQTYLEGEATLKPASAQDIYKGATIGGIAGGGMSGGARGVAEGVQATPEWSDFKLAEAKKIMSHVAAVKSNDTSAYADDPLKAVQVLAGHTKLETTTPEVRAENEAKAATIVADLEEKRQVLFDQTPAGLEETKAMIDGWSDEQKSANQDIIDGYEQDVAAMAKTPPAKAKQIEAQIERLDRQLAQVRKLQTNLTQTTLQDIDLDAQVATLGTPLADNTTAHQEAANKVLTLAMAAPNRVSPEVAAQLAGNTANGLSQAQRTFLHSFSASRIAENRLKGMTKVEKEILFGDSAKKQLGIADYRSKITAAVQSGNTKEVTRLTRMLSGWVATQTQKSELVGGLYARVVESGGSFQIVPTKDKGWIQVSQPMSQVALDKAGGLTIAADSPKLNARMQASTEALSLALKELQNLQSLKGIPSAVDSQIKSTQNSPVDSSGVDSQVTSGNSVNQSAVNSADSQGQLQSKVDSSVDVTEASTPAAEVTNHRASETPAVPAKNAKDAWGIAVVKKSPDAIRTQVRNIPTEKIEAAHQLFESMLPLNTQNPFWERNELPEEVESLETAIQVALDQLEIRQEMAQLEEERAAMSSEEQAVAEALDQLPSNDVDVLITEESLTDEQPNPATEEQATAVSESETGGDTQQREADDPAQEEDGGSQGRLTVFEKTQDWAGEQLATVFQKLNLVAEFMVQKATKDTDKTQRPLVAVKDFLSAWNKDAGLAREYTGVEVLSDNQVTALNHFKKTANQWMEVLQSNLVDGYFSHKDRKVKANPNFRYTDPIQFLLEQVDGKTDLEENVKLAIIQGAYAWVADNGYSSAFSTREEVKAMFGAQEYESISDKFYFLVAGMGTNEQQLANSIGQKIVQSLGLKAKKDTPANILPQLEASLGTHALKILFDKKILARDAITGAQMKEGLPDRLGKSIDPSSEMGLVRLVRNADRSLAETANGIAEASKGSQMILSKLFGVESDLIVPNWGAQAPTQSRIRNTLQGIPKILKKYMKHEDSVPNRVMEDTWSLFNAMDESVVLAIAGYEDIDPAMTHVTNRKGIEAKNDGLKREFERVRDYFQELTNTSPLKLKQSLFFVHEVWKNQRVGIKTNMINPQTSKLHRGLLYRPEWETEVSSTDDAMMDNFRLRVAEGLGVKTDKQGNPISLDDFKRLTDPASTDPKVVAIRQAVEAIQGSWDSETKTWPEGQIPKEYQQAILAGVQAGKEKTHSLNALIALAQYQSAKAKGGDFKFTVRMMGEIDGVTNGPMLSHLALGAAASVKGLFDILNKGGFFQVGSPFKNYNLWRDPANGLNHRDLYETTIGHVMDIVNQQDNKEIQESVWAITGRLDNDDGSILKEGRDIIKKPLTAMIFGSALKGAVDSMFEAFVETTYKGFEKVAKTEPEKQEAARVAYLKHLNRLLRSEGAEPVPNLSVEDLLAYEFNKDQVRALRAAFDGTIGDAVKATMKKHFDPFMKMRGKINNTAQASFALYDAVYQSIKGEFIKELEAKGEIFVLKLEGQSVAQIDLTAEQEQALQERIKAINPTLNTLMSQRSGGDLTTGLHISKASRRFSAVAAYQTSVKFARRLGKGFSLTVASYEQAMTAPGVAMLVMMMHSLDSAISHMAAMFTQVLNVHDAHGSGLKHFTRTAQNLNKATWKAALEYSPTAEMRDSWSRTVLGLDQMLQSGESVEAMVPAVRLALQELAKKHGYKGKPLAMNKVLVTITDQMTQAAYDADSVRLDALSQMAYIDQYALEGGHYEVTDADRAEAAQKRAELSPLVDPQVLDAIARINETLAKTKVSAKPVPASVQPMEEVELSEEPPKANKADPLWQQPGLALGEAYNYSDPKLVALLQQNPKTTAGALIDVLAQSNQLSPINKKILSLVSKLVDPKLKVELLTSSSDLSEVDVMETPAIGWFIRGTDKNPNGAIFVLGPEFMHSSVQAEVLLHELTHAAFIDLMDSAGENITYNEGVATTEAGKALEELRDLYSKAEEFVNSNSLHQWAPALENMDEFIAYGMTSRGFQTDVLTKITMQSKTSKSKLVTGMQRFISSLTALLFKKPNERLDNGLTLLIQNVSALAYQTAQDRQKTKRAVNLSMAAHVARDYTTLSMFDALRPVQSNLAPSFEAHLKGLLGDMVEKLHGSFGSLMASRMVKQTLSPVDIWAKAKSDGIALFAQESLASGFPFTDQEAFAAQYVESTVRAALDRSDAQATQSYRELSKLYREIRTVLKTDGSDFNTGDAAQDQALYDFIFKMEAGADGRTDHLARFATLGLTNQAFNKVLDRATSTVSKGTSKSFTTRLANWLNQAMEWLVGKATHTYAGQQANEKLLKLVDNLVHIELQTKARLESDTTNFLAPVEERLTKAAQDAKKAVGDLAQTHLVQGSSKTLVKFAGNVVSTVAGERVDQFMNALEQFRDKHFKEHLGVVAGITNEIRGARPGNMVFHSLLRASKHLEGLRKNIITGTGKVVLESFRDKGENLSQDEKKAISAVFLRTDLSALLDSLGMSGIQRVLNSKSALAQEIGVLETALNAHPTQRIFFINEARFLGHYMATGETRGTHLLMNAHNIARAEGTGRKGQLTEAEAQAAEAIIDRLASLYALKYSNQKDLDAARSVLNGEMNRGTENGVEMVLKMHRQLQQQSRERLFKNSPGLMMKGYTPEIYNPHREIVIATKVQGAELEAMGYKPGEMVKPDPKDPDQTERQIYLLEHGGLRSHLTGIFSYTGQRAKGSRAASDEVSNAAEWKADQDNLKMMNLGKQAGIHRLFTTLVDPTQVKDTYAAPVMNDMGNVSGYRYLMQHKTKDKLLDRDNRFEKILGTLAGGIFDKETSREQNRKAVEALKAQYDAEYTTRSDSYVIVDESSPDPEYREIYRLLPEETKQAIRDVWGDSPMMVRVDLLDINFGYRKSSLATVFEKDPQTRGFAEKAFVDMATLLMGKKAALRIRQTEDVFQEIVRETKDILVVKTGLTLLGNVTSNFTLLGWYGVPLKHQLHHHKTALRGAMDYKKHSEELDALTMQLASGYITGNRAEMERRVVELKNEIKRNPVKKLIDAGMMPTIVEDVAADEDIYSYKTNLVQKTEAFTAKLNPTVVAAGRAVYMAKDTKIYQAMHYGTQISDFLARYTLYQYATTRQKNPLSHEDAVQLASDAFVNYDIPSHRSVQYLNDMGIVWFTKYYLRIQKVIAHLYAEKPGRALMLLSLSHFFSGVPTLMDSSFIHKLHNPFSIGAFKYPSVLDELATVKMGMSPFN